VGIPAGESSQHNLRATHENERRIHAPQDVVGEHANSLRTSRDGQMEKALRFLDGRRRPSWVQVDTYTLPRAILEMRYIIADPKLSPLADNGGTTRTLALQPDSPAIDARTGSNDDTDQRGRARASGAAADIGADELQADAMFADGFDPH
jgi:hypothetical protein